MQRRKSILIGLLVVACAALAAGCVDAVTEGLSEGVRAGLAEFIQSVIGLALGSVASG